MLLDSKLFVILFLALVQASPELEGVRPTHPRETQRKTSVVRVLPDFSQHLPLQQGFRLPGVPKSPPPPGNARDDFQPHVALKIQTGA